MAQLSRPYQIALAVLAFLVLVWFVALRGHSSSSTPVASTPVSTPATAPASTPESTAASEAKAAAAPTPVYHGATPGVAGLTRAINKAHGAVATSQRDAQGFEHASAQAPGQSAEGTGASTASTGSQPAAAPATATQPAAAPASTTKQAVAPAGTAAKTSKSAAHVAIKPRTVTRGIPTQQAAVESELKQGKVVAVLFWNPKGADDVAVRKELQTVGKQLGGKLAVHTAEANQVGAFGSITQAIQVYQTPTILFVNGKGLTTTLTGFTDAFSIEQTIEEARKA
jgi:hypothetical protein